MTIPVVNKDNFYSRRLEGCERALYDACVDNLAKGIMRGEIDEPAFCTRATDTDSVIHAVLYGCPELFFIDNTINVLRCGRTVALEFKSKYSDVEDKRRELNAEISRIAARLRACGSTYDKLMKLSVILGDIVSGANNAESRFGDAYGALILKEARCEGYAKAAKLILDRTGIKSILALGDARRNGGIFKHAWNIAYCGDKPYGFDFTWNDGGDAGSFPGITYAFLPDSDMNIEHSPQYPYPPCTDGSQTFWARNNGVIRTAADIRGARVVRRDKFYIAAYRFDGAAAAQALQKQAVDHTINAVIGNLPCIRTVYSFNTAFNVLTVYCVAE